MRGAGVRRVVAGIAALALLGAPAVAGAATTTSTSGHSTSSTGATTTTTGPTTTTTAALPALPPTPAPVAWIVVDADSGHVLDGVNIHTPERTASVVKITTALAGLERLPSTAPVVVSQNAVNHGLENENPSGMKVGQTWTVGAVVSLMMVISANDAAYALAEATSGSLQQFALDEATTAKQLGMRDSTFNDPAGLDDNTSYGGGPKMSPFDIAIAVRAALRVPAIAGPARTPTFDFTDPGGGQHHVKNHNQLLPTEPFAYADATGFKTGSTRLAGNTLAASATRNGRTLIAVLLNCYDRYNWAKALLDRAFLTPVGARGIGETLPAVQDLTYSHRATEKDLAVTFLTGTRGLGSGTTVPIGTMTSYRPVTTTVPKHHAVAASAARHGKSSGGGVSGAEVALIALLVLALAVVLLRRRAVRRQRARRESRRQTQAALRRGSLPVVDGRYRAGMRTGKPPQSNVRVHRGKD